MSSELLAQFESGPIIVAAKEAGAGSLLATLLSCTKAKSTAVVLTQEPADRYFVDADIEPIRVHLDAGGWSVRLNEIVAETRPQRIIVGASAGRTIEKTLIDLARQNGVPAIAVIDHYWNLWQRFAGDRANDRWRYQPEVIYVPHPWCRQRLIELGCPVRDIRLFQHMVLDAPISPRSRELRRDKRALLRLSDQDVVILFVSEYGFQGQREWAWDQPAEEDIETLALELLEIATGLAAAGVAIRLLVRPHPAEHRDWSALLEGSKPGIISVDRSSDKATLFALSDIAFGLNSMLLAEAARNGIPSYCRFPSGSYKGPKLSDFCGTITELKTRSEMENVIRRTWHGR
jgi:hypothetical protein